MSLQQLMADDPALFAYIGCMTGTSADQHADFSLALFDKQTLIAHSSHAINIPETLRLKLLKISTTPIVDIDSKERADIESEFTAFLAQSFTSLITYHQLDRIAPERIILSPHGQTIDHRPEEGLTDQLIHGEQLAYETGHPVVFRHRQACIPISQAAPLAPVFLRTLPLDDDLTHVFINGGGIANVCIIHPDKSIKAFDTGPANAPVDAIIRHILKEHKQVIPSELYSGIEKHGYDLSGRLAEMGQSCDQLKDQLLTHSYFQADNINRSLDCSTFGAHWLLTLNSTLSIIDQFTTLCTAIAQSIANGINRVFNTTNTPCKLWLSGGIRHNQFMTQRLLSGLSGHDQTSVGEWDHLALDPDYMESLLMSYLGMCVHSNTSIDLSYCLRSNAKTNHAVPGVITQMVTNHA